MLHEHVDAADTMDLKRNVQRGEYSLPSEGFICTVPLL
jgi:hypothetical protein